MPLVRIDYPDSLTSEQVSKLSETVHQSMIETIRIPHDDKFQVLTPHPVANLICDKNYLGVQRTAAFTVIHITLRQGREPDKKAALYKELAARVNKEVGIPIGDIMVVLAENDLPDWSFGDGIGQYIQHKPV
jgi:phenylpyruvate tautomerase PptA (4-oxalocrotonate tautomerase family)